MLANFIKRVTTLNTHRISNLPILVMMPHSRCNCRCVMCDIWKANHEKKELSSELLAQHVDSFLKLGVREIVFSGGEALMHDNLWNLCSLLKAHNIRLTLLSTGLLLERNAQSVVTYLDGVIVSLDGSAEVHDAIRRIPNGFAKITEGVRAIKKLNKQFPLTARCVLQRHNFQDFINIVHAAKNIGFDQISFLTADVSSEAFNRPEPWDTEHANEVALSRQEAIEFNEIVEQSFKLLQQFYDTKFIAESPLKMRKLMQYYNALNGMGDFPQIVCNAPWVSAVIESDGSVMPCFFHKPYGNIYQNRLESILNSHEAISFRKNLDMSKDERCTKCVCSLKLGLTEML